MAGNRIKRFHVEIIRFCVSVLNHSVCKPTVDREDERINDPTISQFRN